MKKKRFRGIGFYIFLFIIIMAIFASVSYPGNMGKNYTYSDLIKYIQSENVAKITVVEDKVLAILIDGSHLEVNIPSLSAFYFDVGSDIRRQIIENKLVFDIPEPSMFSWIISTLPTAGFVIISLAILLTFFQAPPGSGGRGVLSFGKSRAKLNNSDKKKVTFDDVAGAKEEKAELEEIIDFLKYPGKYKELGARIPKGILLIGPPGTGKTLLAKAVAGEADVPFFSISGSDFVEMFVGVGASRVRDLFEQAKKCSPCIVFIDEIDAVGRHRGAGLGGGHDEREQTLNQLLVEMDGFGANEGIIIIAATNRPDILDPALLRPGRFDRQIVVDVPDVGEREEILIVHSKNKPLGMDVKLKTISKTTVGFTGADLENLMNESALLTARRNKKVINMSEVHEAMIKVIAGPEKKTRVITEKEKKLTAYHEAGHAVVSKLLLTQNNVHQISIIPRGRAGGYTISLPKEDKYYISKTEMLEDIVSLLGGTVAEKMILNDISTGVSNDLDRATKIARRMVMKYGMSDELGPMTFGNDQDEIFIGRDFGHSKNYSENLAAKIDYEIKSIIDNCYLKCQELLAKNIDKLHKIAARLLEIEKIDAEEFESFFSDEELLEKNEKLIKESEGSFENINNVDNESKVEDGDLDETEKEE
ncbi:MAG: ATP-dependent zinc metalloprotease FtsH [Clostridiales bacterium]|nr:ATP-dependent zinc metalloprotease FtsH [Clostridiales bacterium]